MPEKFCPSCSKKFIPGLEKCPVCNVRLEHNYDDCMYDPEGYDRNGYDKDGFDRKGYYKDGYNRYGFNRKGYDKDGFNREGFNGEGYYKDGYNRYGFNREGYDKDGYDRYGFNRKGYDKDGYDRYGFNRKGYDKDGYDRAGFNKDGIHKGTGTYLDQNWLDKNRNSISYIYHTLGDYIPKRSNQTQNKLSEYILLFKDNDKKSVDLFIEKSNRLFREKNIIADIIVPIPSADRNYISPSASRLCKTLAEINQISYHEALTRVKSLPKSHLLPANERLSVQEHYNSLSCSDLVKDKSIILFDDIYTLGRTSQACIRRLKEKGAKKIYLFTLGRTRNCYH